MANSSRYENTRPPYLPPEESVCRSRIGRTGHGTTDCFQIGKGACQGCMLSRCLFNFYAEYIMQNARLDELQAGVKIEGEISITSGMHKTLSECQKVKKNYGVS